MDLTNLLPGREGKVMGISSITEQNDALGRRLLELGFIPGAVVKALHTAPIFGDPRSYMVRGMHVALRAAEAARIAIEPLEQSKGHLP